jgi:hypothetical protein
VRVVITLVSVKITHACQNHTLRVQITLERVVITLMSVIFTCILAKLLSGVWKPHSACENLPMRAETNLLRDEFTLLRVEISLCLYKLHSACINHARACRSHIRSCQQYTLVCGNHTLLCENHTLRVKSHFAGGNCTMHVVVISLLCVLKSHLWQAFTRIVWALHSKK